MKLLEEVSSLRPIKEKFGVRKTLTPKWNLPLVGKGLTLRRPTCREGIVGKVTKETPRPLREGFVKVKVMVPVFGFSKGVTVDGPTVVKTTKFVLGQCETTTTF